jgi:hypothetical protein
MAGPDGALAHPDAAVCPEQAEEHLALYPFPDAVDNHRGEASWSDADHDVVRPVVTMDKADAIPEGIHLRVLRVEAAGR